MSDTRIQTGERWLKDDGAVYDRLNWFIAANMYEASQRRLFRTGDDEQEMLLMRRPVATARAYALFGMLLGALPPAAIFYHFFSYGISRYNHELNGLFPFFLLMNVVCLIVGKIIGGRMGRSMDETERTPWVKMILAAAIYGWGWGLATGAAGGAVAFGVGALVGASLASPIGIVAFILFTILHRLVARGGMIDARHFWPLACGVTITIAALILGM